MTQTDRHPGTNHLMATLTPNPNLPDSLRHISELVHSLAVHLVEDLQDGPELTAGLRKLREAKDCFVLQALIDNRADHGG